MFKKSLLPFLLLTLCLGSCMVISLHPFIGKEEAVIEDSLLGSWGNTKDGRPDERIRFEKQSESEYLLTWEEFGKKDGDAANLEIEASAMFDARLAKIGGQWYLDIAPNKKSFDRQGQPANASLFWLARGHGLVKIDWDKNNLTLFFLSPKYFADAAKPGNGKFQGVSYTCTEDKQFVLTSTTSELQKFLTENAENPELFAEREVYEREAPK